MTDEWKERGAKEGREYAILTNEISSGTFDVSIQAHKAYKLLPKAANLRDHMTSLELALISLGEATATVLHRNRESHNFDALHRDARDAGQVAGRARRDVEQATGESAVSAQNHLALTKPRSKQGATTQTTKRRNSPVQSDSEQTSLFDTPPTIGGEEDKG